MRVQGGLVLGALALVLREGGGEPLVGVGLGLGLRAGTAGAVEDADAGLGGGEVGGVDRAAVRGGGWRGLAASGGSELCVGEIGDLLEPCDQVTGQLGLLLGVHDALPFA